MKTYFIGLGGCGLQTVASLSTRLKKDQNYNPDDYAFTYVDTDMFTYSRINSDSIVIPAADFVDMGPTVPLAIYNGAKTTDRPNANTKRLLEWAIEQKPGHMVLPNHPLSDGATAQRNVGRFGIYNFYEAMERELTAKINRFRELTPDDNGRRDVDIWVIASSCGGTGSSMTMDVLYMINRLAHHVANGEPNVKLVLYMPQTFVDLNSSNPNHRLNGYACMEEINFFRFNFENGNGKSFEPYAVRPTAAGTEIYDFPLYQFLIPVCAENNFGSKMKVDQFYPTIAEMIYYLNTGNGRAFVKSNLSNILAELLQKSDTSSGITSQMIGYGFRAIKKANKELQEYLTRRALTEVINYGLLDQRRPSDFDQLKVEFAQNAILKKLFSLTETVLDSDVTYRYNTTADADALENQIYSAVNNATKYDPNEVSSDVVRAISLKLDRLYTTENYEEQKKAVYAMITGEIDKRVNEFILMNGLNNAYDLLNFVDDFYLEPLCRYIVSTLLPDATGKVNAAKAACATYSKGGLLMALKKAEMNQALKKYKDAVARAITLTIAVQIIRELTESPSGYLEKLRKGDNTNYAGIRNLQKMLESDGTDYKDMYATLAKEFRATEDDIMTVYLPSLAELATGEDNTDWADNNSFDQLYCESVIAQQDITRGLEKIRVPMRTSASGKGLKDIISRIDPDNNLFINIIKSKQISLPTNKETLIIKPIKHVIDTIVNDKSTSAGRWMSEELSEAIKDPRLLPKAFKRTDDLFNSFKNTSRVPVFFPLRSDVSVPDNMRLMFVGNNEGLAGDLGYNPNSKEQQFIHDSSMSDRFMVMCMHVRSVSGARTGSVLRLPYPRCLQQVRPDIAEIGAQLHSAEREPDRAIGIPPHRVARQESLFPARDQPAMGERQERLQQPVRSLRLRGRSGHNRHDAGDAATPGHGDRSGGKRRRGEPVHHAAVRPEEHQRTSATPPRDRQSEDQISGDRQQRRAEFRVRQRSYPAMQGLCGATDDHPGEPVRSSRLSGAEIRYPYQRADEQFADGCTRRSEDAHAEIDRRRRGYLRLLLAAMEET